MPVICRYSSTLQTYPTHAKDGAKLLPPGTFFTCSSDDTIRIWNLESNNNLENYIYKRNIFSDELLKIMYMDPELVSTGTDAVA